MVSGMAKRRLLRSKDMVLVVAEDPSEAGKLAEDMIFPGSVAQQHELLELSLEQRSQKQELPRYDVGREGARVIDNEGQREVSIRFVELTVRLGTFAKFPNLNCLRLATLSYRPALSVYCLKIHPIRACLRAQQCTKHNGIRDYRPRGWYYTTRISQKAWVRHATSNSQIVMHVRRELVSVICYYRVYTFSVQCILAPDFFSSSAKSVQQSCLHFEEHCSRVTNKCRFKHKLYTIYQHQDDGS